MDRSPSILSESQTNLEKQEETHPSHLSDEELLPRYEAGDQGAFEELFRRYRQRIYYFILRFLRDKQSSQDAVQDLFLRVMRNPAHFKARSRFSTWLHAVARNLCIDMLRKRKYRNAVSIDHASRQPDQPSLLERLSSPDVSPEEAAVRGSLRLKLLLAIRAIPDEQRAVFLMREVGGLPFAEIAKIVGIQLNTAKSRMRYALVNLRKALTKLGVEP